MKNIHVLGIVLVAVLASGGVGVASASALTVEWLSGANQISSALAVEPIGSLTLGATNGLKLKIEAEVLCVGAFVGTVGPGAGGSVTEVLNEAKTDSTLLCASVKTCEGNSEVRTVNLPWLTTLVEMSPTEYLDGLETGGKGNPGWEVICKTPLGAVTETCTGC